MPALTENLPVPTGSLRLTGVARLAMEWSRLLSRSDVEAAAVQGKPVTCRKGCAACCHQWIPVSPAEAFSLMESLEALPPASRKRRLARFDVVRAELDGKREAWPSPWHDPDAYFSLGLACPFLERGACTIHSDRPLACREQLVVSDPRHCGTFPNFGIEVLALSHPLHEALLAVSAELLGDAPQRIPLVSVPAWVEGNPEAGQREWDAGKVAEALAFQLFSR